MGRKRSTSGIACPDHRGSSVVRYGVRIVEGGTLQRFRCTTKSGLKHYLVAPIRGDDELEIVRPAWAAPPRCPTHGRSKVVRAGSYGVARKRQRYRCFPDCAEHAGSKCPTAVRENGKSGRWIGERCPNRPHNFVPPISRRWVEGHGFTDACETCDQPRGVHRGEANAARKHTFSSVIVAGGLIRASGGDTYGEVGRWGLGERAKSLPRGMKPASRAGASTKFPGRKAGNNAWHTSADWVEVWSPSFWGPLDDDLRDAAALTRQRVDAALAAGQPRERPLVWIADEVPIGKKGRGDAFVVMVVAEVEWLPTGEPRAKIRLARALPDKTLTAWLLVWSELAGETGIWPDFLVSDKGRSLLGAADRVFDARHRWVPSLWHFANAVRANSRGRARNDQPDPAPARIEQHLGQLKQGSPAVLSQLGWRDWWQELEHLYAVEQLEPTRLDALRKGWGDAYEAAIAEFGGLLIPLSNAAIEGIQRLRLKRVFEGRDHAMTSIERTNALLDLVVAREHGQLSSEAEVARRLRGDAHEHGGWTHPPRSINDPANPYDPTDRYKSLRDRTLTQRLVFARGLA